MLLLQLCHIIMGGIQAHRGNVLYNNVLSTISDEYSFSGWSSCTLVALGYQLCTVQSWWDPDMI
jgi:hypothetical protein